MLNRSGLAMSGVAFVLATALIALPACGKKKDTGGNSGPPDGYQGSKGGPPTGFGMPFELNDGNRTASVRTLRQIGRAFHDYHDRNNYLPHAIADSSGKPGLSWRVAILPYIGQDGLYKSFKLTEPWDSEHNKALIAKMPASFAPPGLSTNGNTYYRSFSGQGAVMAPSTKPGQPGQQFRGVPLSAFSDGTAYTIIVAEANEPVIWTKPDELPFAPGKPPKLGGGVFAEGFHAVFADGAVRFLRSSTLNPTTLSNLIQTNDGQIVDIPN